MCVRVVYGHTHTQGYPAVGDNQTFRAPNYEYLNYTLNYSHGMFNIWQLPDYGSLPGAEHQAVLNVIMAVKVLENMDNDTRYRPDGPFKQNSWLEEYCVGFGILPFDFTCSDKINILVLYTGEKHIGLIFGSIKVLIRIIIIPATPTFTPRLTSTTSSKSPPFFS